MKGLAEVLGTATKGPKPPLPTEPAEPEKPETDASSEMTFARLASEASAAGDHDAAAEALVSAIKACVSSYGPKK